MLQSKRLAMVLCGTFTLGGAAGAHHGFGSFDNSAELMTLTGVVTDVAIINPHSWLYFTVTGEAGDEQHWRCELRAATTISLIYGQHGFTRTIHMNLDAHPTDIEPSRAGHSIGRWEDDVLVVDTVGFLPGLLTGQILLSGELHVIERFSFDPEMRALTREYTAQDPLYFTGQHRGSDTLYVADLPHVVHPCQELMHIDFSVEGQ